jgi:hypothetical protein
MNEPDTSYDRESRHVGTLLWHGYFVDNVNCHNSFNILFSGITGDKMPPKKQEGKEKKPKPEAKTFSEGDLVPYLIKLFFSSSLPED